ncbi:MAG: transcription termination factor Rho [Deltaproteobacteria bacterium]|nr:transcription termination factor Rho [Deltaproteobacteria bacterium]
MTAKELREVALGIPEISGVHAMKKEELLAAIQKAWGITTEKAGRREKKKKAAVSVADLKARIQETKAKRAEAIQKKDRKMARIYRRRISRLKKRTRRAA